MPRHIIHLRRKTTTIRFRDESTREIVWYHYVFIQYNILPELENPWYNSTCRYIRFLRLDRRVGTRVDDLQLCHTAQTTRRSVYFEHKVDVWLSEEPRTIIFIRVFNTIVITIFLGIIQKDFRYFTRTGMREKRSNLNGKRAWLFLALSSFKTLFLLMRFNDGAD